MSVKPILLLPDALHINERNFASFHNYVTTNKVQMHVNKERADWIAVYGEYEPFAEQLKTKVELLSCVPPERLFTYSYHGVNLFAVARAEMMARVVVTPSWHEGPFPDTARGIFDKLYAEHRSVLLYNLAAALDWLEFWKAKLPTYSPQPTHACIFSGSLIYTRTLIELLRMTPTRVMVMESYFTGNDFYFEEKYEPVPNNSDLRHAAVYKALPVPADANEYDRERIKAINKVLMGKNKNVQQPENPTPLPFKAGERPLVVVLGQVVNDFSVINYADRGISTVAFYRSLIDALVRAGCNVVFKDHPWELKKTHVKRPFTRQLLEQWLDTQDEEFRSRVFIDTELDILKLFKACDFACGLNTQSLIEAAFEGVKPTTFGNAFYGRKGFTHDYDLADVERFAADIKSGRISGTLTLEEVDAFELFLVKSLQKHLVTVNPSGVSMIGAKLTPPATIALVSRDAVKKAAAAPALAAAKPAAAPAAGKAAGAPAAPAKPAAPAAAAKPAAAAPAAGTAVVVVPEAKEDTPEIIEALAQPPKRYTSKLDKLLRNPLGFMRDSRMFRRTA